MRLCKSKHTIPYVCSNIFLENTVETTPSVPELPCNANVVYREIKLSNNPLVLRPEYSRKLMSLPWLLVPICINTRSWLPPKRELTHWSTGKFELKFRYVIFKRILVIDGWGIFCEIALIWMSLDFTDDQPLLVQVMAWCRQATSHCLSQCWPRSLSPYGVIRPKWVKLS